MFIQKIIKYIIGVSTLVIATVVAGISVAGLSTSANAVNLSSDNLGDAMIFPYYSTRNGFASFFNITNTSDKTVLFKVRWNEGENGREAQAINVVLSPYDAWTVATVGASNGGARAITGDNSCTSPRLPTVGTTAEGGSVKGINFTNAAFTGSNFDTGNTGLDRTREGYFTVFEMGVVDFSQSELTDEQIGLAIRVHFSAKHNLNSNQGAPSCLEIDSLFTDETTLAKLSEIISEPENVLKGRAVLIELSTGVAFGYDPIVFENFFSPQGVDTHDTENLLALPTQPTPNLNSANPAAVTMTSKIEVLYTSELFKRPVDVISYLLSRSSIINDYNITSGSQTDWVVTFPTKSFYVDRKTGTLDGEAFKLPAALSPSDNGDPLPPFVFAETFADPDTDNDGQGDISDSEGESCLSAGLRIWNREELELHGTPGSPTGFIGYFPPMEICKEVNIFSFGNSNIFDSKLRNALYEQDTSQLPGLNGWMQIRFWHQDNTLPLAATGTISTTGLPVTGMRLEARRNSKFAGKNYGSASDHAYTHESPF